MTILLHNELPIEMKTRILLVDDDPFILEMLKSAMVALGHAFETAMDGEAAKAKLKQGGFTMVLTDLTMPRCDGMELLKHQGGISPHRGYRYHRSCREPWLYRCCSGRCQRFHHQALWYG